MSAQRMDKFADIVQRRGFFFAKGDTKIHFDGGNNIDLCDGILTVDSSGYRSFRDLLDGILRCVRDDFTNTF
jgi:hypothetical protein